MIFGIYFLIKFYIANPRINVPKAKNIKNIETDHIKINEKNGVLIDILTKFDKPFKSFEILKKGNVIKGEITYVSNINQKFNYPRQYFYFHGISYFSPNNYSLFINNKIYANKIEELNVLNISDDHILINNNYKWPINYTLDTKTMKFHKGDKRPKINLTKRKDK